jgi:hypothetical protein
VEKREQCWLEVAIDRRIALLANVESLAIAGELAASIVRTAPAQNSIAGQ